MGPGASPGASHYSTPLLSWVGWGFVAERRPARLRFAFLPCGVRVSWVARLVGWLAFRAVGNGVVPRQASAAVASLLERERTVGESEGWPEFAS